jgi:hypothetical protein
MLGSLPLSYSLSLSLSNIVSVGGILSRAAVTKKYLQKI